MDKHPAPGRPLPWLSLIFALTVLTLALTQCQQEGNEATPAPVTQPSPQEEDKLTATRPPLAEVTRTQSAEGSPESADTTPTPTSNQQPATGEETPQPPTPATSNQQPATSYPPGALIAVAMTSQVGVLLDEFPFEMRERIAEDIRARPEAFWLARATRQVQLTHYRLTFRNFFYDFQGQLPLPPESLWQITLDPAGPRRAAEQGHDLILWDYTFKTTILTDEASPAAAEPALAEFGGRWEERFILPYDPELLLQRTGNACVNEGGFPPHSVDSENAWEFYDHTCLGDSGGPLGCHRTRLSNQSCFEALAANVGLVDTNVVFERVEWDAGLADSVRVGEVLNADAPNLAALAEDMNNYRVIYRYFEPNSCALVEQCVGDSGWRRLLQFDATVHNQGGETLHIGPVTAEDPEHNLFQYNACHDHFHFSNYGTFTFETGSRGGSRTAPTDFSAFKQAFCVESTGRLSNNEFSPLTHNYTCRFQGVQAGWVDEYGAGLECQWVDITGAVSGQPSAISDQQPATITATLTFLSNENQFLCEGEPVVDENGEPVWEDSGLTTEDGRPIDRPVCEFVPDWDANNQAAIEVSVAAAGSFVTEPCQHDDLGPKRNCGFTAQEPLVVLTADGRRPTAASSPAPSPQPPAPTIGAACTPNQPVRLTCSVAEPETRQILRLCEVSQALGLGTACAFEDALANAIVGQSTEVEFTCPAARDENEPGGAYTFYTAPLWAEDEAQEITCEIVP